MNTRKRVVTRTPAQLAKALNLSPIDGLELEIRAELNDQIIRIARRSGLTHAAIARAARTSRTRITAILNRNTHQISTDLLLRVLAALGYGARLVVHRARPAA